MLFRSRRIRNRVVSRLPPPQTAVLAALVSHELRQSFLDRWKPDINPYPRGRNITFWQFNEDDTAQNLELCREALPSAIDGFLTASNGAQRVTFTDSD